MQRQAENLPQAAQAVAGQQVVKQSEERTETVQTPQELEGNKVREKTESDQPDARRRQKRERAPGAPLDVFDAESLGVAADGEHLIDFTA
ncbi:MAG: hypothetical protein JO101_00865 [Candidatus Eremiobacteraeota bacterium]|nr:hypothetical protein [Candidatus Eremiobacteraeota bacterium]MBV8353843.1 hypothetical protein [Candidatus Eremiobacteraeota bacterium]